MNRTQLLQPMDHIRDVLRRMLDATPAEHWLHQPFPGANHIAWTLGHLAWADDLVHRTITATDGGLPDPVDWAARFGWGSVPAANWDDSPSPETLRHTCEQRRGVLRDWLLALPEARLSEPPPGDLAGWFPCYGVLPAALAHHDAMHVGQLQVVRKHLGLAPVFA